MWDTGNKGCPKDFVLKQCQPPFKEGEWWSSKHKAYLPADSILTSFFKDRVTNNSADQPNTCSTVGRSKKLSFLSPAALKMAFLGVTDPAAPLTVEQRGTESLGFVRAQVLGLLADKLLAFDFFGAADTLCHLCCYAITGLVCVPYDVQTPALIRMLPILWAQRCCKA